MFKESTKNTTNTWKVKAIERRKELTKERKRNKELRSSRDNWKCKYKELSKRISKVAEGNIANSLTESYKPDRYKYSCVLITLCIKLLSYSGSSLRSSRHFIAQLYIVLEFETFDIPSHTTIRMWACKLGYYQNEFNCIDEGDWSLIVDESVSLGENRVLLVLGLRLDQWDFKYAARSQDIEVLHFGVSPKWKSEEISSILEGIMDKINVKYVVSDKGNNLMKSYKISDLLHIPDCTHALAKALEHYCKKCEEASSFLSQCGLLRQKWNMGKKTVYMPPSQRKKARFHNLAPITDWAKKVLVIIDTLPDEIQLHLSFLHEKQQWINEFDWINKMIQSINVILKTNGFNNKTYVDISKKIAARRLNKQEISCYGENFLIEIDNYLSSLDKIASCEQTLFCCSDIIESTFGRMKYRTSPNTPFGMTEFALAIASLGKSYNKEQVTQIMETVKEKDIKEWKADNLPPSLFEKKRALLGENFGEEIYLN